jgi:hypothetical protein
MSSLERAHLACELGECQAWIPDPIRTNSYAVRASGERGPGEITPDASVPYML